MVGGGPLTVFQSINPTLTQVEIKVDLNIAFTRFRGRVILGQCLIVCGVIGLGWQTNLHQNTTTEDWGILD